MFRDGVRIDSEQTTWPTARFSQMSSACRTLQKYKKRGQSQDAAAGLEHTAGLEKTYFKNQKIGC